MRNYKYSRFNTVLDITPNTSVLYNALSDKCIAFINKKKRLLSTNPEDILENDSIFFNNLINIKAILNTEGNELDEVIHKSKIVDNDETEFLLIINPTMNCNFKCWYCYETHIKGSKLLPKTLNKIFKLIDNILLEKKNLNKFTLSFFGGEPLMYFHKTSALIIDHLRSKYLQYPNVNFSINFTSNGYLINAKIIDFLISKNESNHFQITLDGNEEFHNKNRNLEKKGGSYHKILSVIKLLIKNNIQVLLRINYTSENIDSTFGIINDIKDIPVLDKKNLTIGFFRVWQDDKSIDLKDKIDNLKLKFSENGFIIDDNETILDNLKNSCYADKINELVINYNGDVYKCTAREFNQKNKYGILNQNGDIDWIQEKLNEWSNSKMHSKVCHNCRILPLCGGGCHQINLETKGNNRCNFGYNDNDKDSIILKRLSEFFIYEEI